MNIGIRVKLSTMMFLEFFIWGAWFVTMGTYLTVTLKATGTQNAGAYATQSLGAIIAPFVIGLTQPLLPILISFTLISCFT
jgi:hypothetical protein